MAKNWVQRTLKVSRRYNEDDLSAIAVEVVKYIRDRTLDGKGPGGKSWSGKAGEYSKAYMDSLNFKIGRKSGTVNLKLSGDMLEAIGLLEVQKGKIKYGVDDSDPVAGKVEGNVRGTYGRSSPISGKARDFLELTEKELDEILSQFPLKDPVKKDRKTTSVLASKTAREIIIDDEDEDDL